MMLKIAPLVIIAKQVSSIGSTDDPSSLRKWVDSVAHTLGGGTLVQQQAVCTFPGVWGLVCMSSCEPTGFDGDFTHHLTNAGPFSLEQARDWCEGLGAGCCEFHQTNDDGTGEVAWKSDGCIESREDLAPSGEFHTAVMCTASSTDRSLPPVDPAPAPNATILCGELNPDMVCNGGMDAVCSNETLTLDQCEDWCATQGVGCCGMVKDYVEGAIMDCGVCKFWEGLSSCSRTQGEGLAATMCTSEMV